LLRAESFARFKFRRQHPCGPYVLDFYCLRKRVAVELDGGQDFDVEAERYDERRTVFLGRRGITVLRFSSELIFREIEGVQEVILAALGGADRSP
jgi:very-short-patch-repair endonuclease